MRHHQPPRWICWARWIVALAHCRNVPALLIEKRAERPSTLSQTIPFEKRV
jgi:hypothetical protein